MNRSIRDWQKKYNEGAFAKGDFDTQCNAGWYDWFCKDDSLVRYTEILAKPIVKLENSKRVNLDTMYVFFKNNCPMCGPLYNDFRICDLKEGNVLYCVTHKNPHDREKKLWNVYAVCEGMNDKEDYNLYKFATTKELVAWLNEK